MYLSSANETTMDARLSSYMTGIYVSRLRAGILPAPTAIMSLKSPIATLRNLGGGTVVERLEIINATV